MTFNPFVLFVVETNYMYDGVGTSLCHRSQKMPFRTCDDCSFVRSRSLVSSGDVYDAGIHGSWHSHLSVALGVLAWFWHDQMHACVVLAAHTHTPIIILLRENNKFS